MQEEEIMEFWFSKLEKTSKIMLQPASKTLRCIESSGNLLKMQIQIQQVWGEVWDCVFFKSF